MSRKTQACHSLTPSVPTWREALTAYILDQAKPQEKYGHQPRLYALTCQLRQFRQIPQLGAPLALDQPSPEPYDDDIVFAAAFLHDLGVFIGHRPEDPELLARWDNTTYAIAQSPALLHGVGFPSEKVAAVLECIRTHQPAFEPQSLEATLLRDADILEQLGAIAILRTVCKVGRDTRFHTFTQACASLQLALDTLPGLLRLPAARALAEPRIAALQAFLSAVGSEAGENLF